MYGWVGLHMNMTKELTLSFGFGCKYQITRPTIFLNCNISMENRFILSDFLPFLSCKSTSKSTCLYYGMPSDSIVIQPATVIQGCTSNWPCVWGTMPIWGCLGKIVLFKNAFGYFHCRGKKRELSKNWKVLYIIQIKGRVCEAYNGHI